MIDEKKINPNLDELYKYFSRITERYFDEIGPKEDYFETVSCYNCKSREIASEFFINRFRHVRCKNCGMIYVNPRFKESIAHDLYSEDDYSEFYKIKLIPSIEYRKNVLGVRKYDQIMEYFDSPGKVLDIGCGVGEVLSVFQERGWDCTGVEFNEFASNYAKKEFSLNIINKSIYDFDQVEKYDLIMLWGVLEHFYDPTKILLKINEILADNGLLVLEVPSADSLMVRFYESTSGHVDRIIEGDRHLMLFSNRGFSEMLDKCGFCPEKIQSNGLDISTLNRLEMNGKIDLEDVNDLQTLVDRSMQGDLLRGFFRKKH